MKKKLTIGILAHVDAGKTTLSEALLYISGKIRTLGRVDHKNTYLDTYSAERERGITIFSKQARFSSDGCDFILLDTPGHVDFSAETERTLSLLDYAILLISAPDGVQNHTKTLWHLLEYYRVPTFIFVNKTDIATDLKEDTEAYLSRELSHNIAAFYEKDTREELEERLAYACDELFSLCSAGEGIDDSDISECIAERRLFPCLFGSALRTSGVDFLIETLDRYTKSVEYDENEFGASVYKITRDGNTRLTFMKVTGGNLSVRDEISYIGRDGKRYNEKISRIRLYSGDKFEQVDTVRAGEVCAVTGLSASYASQGLGYESDSKKPVLESVLSYRIILPPEADVREFFPKFKELEEEEPTLCLCWNEELSQLEARLMGEIQTDILKRMISERFGIECEFDTGKILYKEKAASRSIGVGHFEPLRHYAEVQLLIEPQPEGTGLVFDTRIPENQLETNWQRLILSHLYEKNHRGVLTGALLTDTKITLVAGKAHQKHTEGGDFREATGRAVRHGLMKSGCILLEPYYKFTLDVPSECTGRAISDLQNKCAEFEIESAGESSTRITGHAPVSELHSYTKDVIAYTRGRGTLSCVSSGYKPCHNTDEVVKSVSYDPVSDLENPPCSVFCAHGAGFVVPWNEVDSYKHLDAGITLDNNTVSFLQSPKALSRKYSISDEDLEKIMLREFGPIRRRRYSEPKILSSEKSAKKPKKKSSVPHRNMLIIDGYNVIHAWEGLRDVASYSLEKARDMLCDTISNYAAFTKIESVIVFDAYLVKDNMGHEALHDGIRVVYTKEDQTADAYIEKMMSELGPNYDIRVVTGDRLVQFSALHSGILRMTAAELEAEITSTQNEITEFIKKFALSK